MWHTPQPLTVGFRIAFIAHFLGKELSYTYEVIELSAYNTLYERTNNPVVALNRSVVLGEVAGYEKAIEELEMMKELPSNCHFNTSLGEMYFKTGNKERAAFLFNKALSLTTSNV